MKKEINKIRTTILALAKRIEDGDYPHNCREWGGADVVITSKNKSEKPKDGFYPEPRYVITPYSYELSWLFEQLRDSFTPFIDSCSKIEFYGRLANMARRYQQKLKGKEENARDLLLAVLHESFAILEEMEEGNFKFLPVAIDNTILDDLIERAESEGYLGPEETEKFFEEMERRYHNA